MSAPDSGEPGRPAGPLTGVRVVELAGVGPAPFAAMVLSDLGADVIRIDRPPRPDGNRGGSGADYAPGFSLVNRGRRSVMLDLKIAQAQAAVREMASNADILLEGFRPGIAEKLGVGPDICLSRNPRLVYGRMTGWGQHGPRSATAGHDINYIALTGALHAIGRKDEPPTVPLNLVGDFGGGALVLVVGVLAALWEAQASGKGQVVDAAIVDGASLLMTMMYGMAAAGRWKDERGSNRLDSGLPWYDVYETADGRWVAVGALEDRFYSKLVSILGLSREEADRDDPAKWPQLRQRLAEIFRSKTRDEWDSLLRDTDACVTPVLSMAEAPLGTHARERETFVHVHGVRQPAPAPRFSRTPTAIGAPPAYPGQHTLQVLADWGISNVAALLKTGSALQR